jgi:hypothetical protein
MVVYSMAPCFSRTACHLGNGGFFLAAGHVDAVHIGILLGQDGIDGHGGFADLAVADDQLTLAAAHGGHGVNALRPV